MSAIRQIEQLFETLDKYQQLLLIERLVGKLRRSEINEEEIARQLEGLADEEGLNAPYPIPEGMYTEAQLKPRGER